MKSARVLVLGVTVICALIAATGCKKDNPAPEKTYLVSEFGDTTGAFSVQFTYDNEGHLTRIENPTSTINISYNNGKVVKRLSTTGGSVTGIDSVFYDGNNRIATVIGYDGTATIKQQTTSFTYNGDNTVNSATVDYENAATDDELFDFTYSGGKLTQRTKSVKILGTYKLANKVEFLAYDDKVNPFAKVFRSCLLDVIEAFIYFSAYPNNATSVKSTMYDTGTGNVTSVSSVSETYDYGSNNLPIMFHETSGGTTVAYYLHYIEL